MDAAGSYDFMAKILLVGDEGAGKRTLLDRWTEKRFRPRPHSIDFLQHNLTIGKYRPFVANSTQLFAIMSATSALPPHILRRIAAFVKITDKKPVPPGVDRVKVLAWHYSPARFDSTSTSVYRGVHGIVVVFDTTGGFGFCICMW